MNARQIGVVIAVVELEVERALAKVDGRLVLALHQRQ
jgi:hypothetical protein